MNNPTRNKHRTDRALKSWRAKIEEQQTSGQKPGAFCRQRKICSTGFYAWRKRLGMKGSDSEPVVRSARLLPGPLKSLSGAGFLRLDPASTGVIKDHLIEFGPRVMWIETPGGYRVAVNGGVGLAEVFSLLKNI